MHGEFFGFNVPSTAQGDHWPKGNREASLTTSVTAVAAPAIE